MSTRFATSILHRISLFFIFLPAAVSDEIAYRRQAPELIPRYRWRTARSSDGNLHYIYTQSMTHEYILTRDILRSNPPTRPRKPIESHQTLSQVGWVWERDYYLPDPLARALIFPEGSGLQTRCSRAVQSCHQDAQLAKRGHGNNHGEPQRQGLSLCLHK